MVVDQSGPIQFEKIMTPQEEQTPRRIAVDFDNTIADTDFPKIKSIKPGAREALALFRKLGFKVIIWSCRTCHWDYDVYGGDREQPTLERERVKDMIAFLDAEGVEYDEIDDGSKGKPGADYYIDDKGVRFVDNWQEIAETIFMRTTRQLEERTPYSSSLVVKRTEPIQLQEAYP